MRKLLDLPLDVVLCPRIVFKRCGSPPLVPIVQGPIEYRLFVHPQKGECGNHA